jgi:hypothetical protein
MEGTEQSRPDTSVPLTHHRLNTADGRQAFLWSLYWDHQQDGLVTAVQHVWRSLAEPRAVRCERMAASLGLPGRGRRALRKVLERFLQQMTYEVDVPDLPARAAYDDFDEWNRDCLRYFAAVQARFDAVIDRYEAVLDGRPPPSALPVQSATVVNGPWKATGPEYATAGTRPEQRSHDDGEARPRRLNAENPGP